MIKRIIIKRKTDLYGVCCFFALNVFWLRRIPPMRLRLTSHCRPTPYNHPTQMAASDSLGWWIKPWSLFWCAATICNGRRYTQVPPHHPQKTYNTHEKPNLSPTDNQIHNATYWTELYTWEAIIMECSCQGKEVYCAKDKNKQNTH